MPQILYPTDLPPFVLVDGVPNFREIGGYLCDYPPNTGSSLTQSVNESQAKEWHIRQGFLFRAAQPSRISREGMETLTKRLLIQNIFDFRSNEEVELVKSRYPDSILDIQGTTRHGIPIYQVEDHSPVSLTKRYGVTSEVIEGQATNQGFVKAYEAIARKAAQTGSFQAIMQHISKNPPGAILFHCTLGKDRTGVFAALLLKLCGVSDKDIIADYELTTHGLGTWQEHLIQRLLQRDECSTREQAESIIASNPDDMRVFLTNIVAAKFGGAREYFVKLCKLENSQLDQIISNLVVPKPI